MCYLDILTFEGRTDWLSQNIGMELPYYAAYNPERWVSKQTRSGGFRVAVVHGDYPRGQISKEEFASILQAIGRLLDEFPEKWFTPRVVDYYWTK
jgi:hypothetical protein